MSVRCNGCRKDTVLVLENLHSNRDNIWIHIIMKLGKIDKYHKRCKGFYKLKGEEVSSNWPTPELCIEFCQEEMWNSMNKMFG